jgi:putative transposase
VKRAYEKRQGFEEWVLPQEFRIEVAELAGALKEGLTTIGLKAALVMAQQMLEAEVTQIAGAKGPHQSAAGRRAVRDGQQGGYVVLAGRKVKMPQAAGPDRRGPRGAAPQLSRVAAAGPPR